MKDKIILTLIFLFVANVAFYALVQFAKSLQPETTTTKDWREASQYIRDCDGTASIKRVDGLFVLTCDGIK